MVEAQQDKEVEKQRIEREKRAAAAEETLRKAFLVKMIVWFYLFMALAFSLMVAGPLTPGWFVSSSSDEATGPSDSPVTFNQNWALSFFGLYIKTEFCDESINDCIRIRDQFLSYDVTDNEPDNNWPEHLHGSLAEITSAQSVAIGCWIVWLFGFMTSGYVFLSTLIWREGRKRIMMFGNASVQFIMAMLGFVGIVVFADSTTALREQMKSESVFKDSVMELSRPDLAISYSVFLCLAAVLFSIGTIAPLVITTFKIEERIQASVQVDNVRDKRIKQYFQDLTNTTHQKERHPMDDVGGMLKSKKPGWTTQVRSQHVNKMLIYDLDQDERLGTAIAVNCDVPQTLNEPAGGKYMAAQPEVEDQLKRQFGKTCAFKLDQSKVQAGIAKKQLDLANQRAADELANPNRRKKVDPNAKRILPRQHKTVMEETVPGMVQEIKYVERDRKVTRAPMPPQRPRPGGEASNELEISVLRPDQALNKPRS